MGLTAGTRLGPYEIVAPLGAGGMGEVYRARDTRLGRDVAIKVLPELAVDKDRQRRFEQEAQLLASLNHPGIAALYGVEESSSGLALIMELAPGQTLLERILHGPLHAEEAIPIARQVAEALEYAHDRGIIHRDLKPANVKLLPDGAVKVLDFGLAKALEVESGPKSSSIVSSPTLTAAATKIGLILGTAAYMSPEQAKGKTVDRRSDVWSFGCLLFEMLTGKMAFTGETVTDTLAAIVRGEPDWDWLPTETPAELRKLVERCLRKDVKSRLQAIGDARIALDEASTPAKHPALLTNAVTAPAVPKAGRWRYILPSIGMVIFAIISLLLWHPWQKSTAPPVLRFNADWGGDGRLYTPYGSAAVLSPDGLHVAYVAEDAHQKRQLYVRALDHLETTPLPATEGARDPFFSPDGEWVAFFAEGKLKKVAIVGGAVVTLCDIQDDRGGTWSEDGTIVYAPFTRTSLFRVPAGGGTPVLFSHLEGNELTHRWPEFLPGGKVVIYTSSADGNNYENADIVAQAVGTNEHKRILRGGYAAHYVPGGFLVFMHQGTLFGVKFDEKTFTASGDPVPLLEHVATNFGNAGTQFSIAPTGTATYISGAAATEYLRLQWLTEDGKLSLLRSGSGLYWSMAFSADGRNLALAAEAGGTQDVWVYDWQRNVPTRLTFGGGNMYPEWTPDGKRISYVADDQGGNFSIWWKRADGSGDAQRLLQSKNRFGPMAWRPDGKVLVFGQSTRSGDSDLMWVSVEGNEKTGWKVSEPKPFLNSPAFEDSPAFSPDGKWLAYHSNESGVPTVWVRPFPGPGGRWQVSTEWGGLPQWSPGRRQIFYENGEHRIMVADYTEDGDTFRIDSPRQWSNVILADRGPVNRNFSLHPDGKRIAVAREAGGDEQAQAPKVTFILNFADDVRSKVDRLKR